MHAPALVHQFTHLVHPNRSHRPSYLLRKTADMTGKIQKEKTDKHEKNEQTVHAIIHSLFKRVIISLLTDPGQTTCFARLTMLSSLTAAAPSLVSRTSRKGRIVVEYQ